jgi:hypothetical protein
MPLIFRPIRNSSWWSCFAMPSGKYRIIHKSLYLFLVSLHNFFLIPCLYFVLWFMVWVRSISILMKIYTPFILFLLSQLIF